MKTLYKVGDTVWYVTSGMKAKKSKIDQVEQTTNSKGVTVRYKLRDKTMRMHPDVWSTLQAVRDYYRAHFDKLLANLYP